MGDAAALTDRLRLVDDFGCLCGRLQERDANPAGAVERLRRRGLARRAMGLPEAGSLLGALNKYYKVQAASQVAQSTFCLRSCLAALYAFPICGTCVLQIE